MPEKYQKIVTFVAKQCSSKFEQINFRMIMLNSYRKKQLEFFNQNILAFDLKLSNTVIICTQSVPENFFR